MKGILGIDRFALLHNAVDVAVASDRIFTEVYTGGAKNGTLVLVANFNAGSDIRNVQVWTSSRSDFAAAGTALAAIASDGLRQVALTSDTDGVFAKGTADTALTSDLTISSNTVTAIQEDGMYVFNLRHLSKFVNVQYDSAGILTQLHCVFIGHDLEEAPWGGVRAAY